MIGRFYDFDDGEVINQALIKCGGDEIVLDLAHSDGYLYTISIKRYQGSLFKGTAVSQPGSEVAMLTCRVYKDASEGIILIVGSDWKYPGEIKNCRWQVELQA